MIIGKRKLGHNEKPYIIAELSANHGGSLERAKKSILEASRCGVDAIKIQSYTPDTMTIKCDKQDFKIHDGIWKGKDLYELYQSAYTPFEWHEDLYSYANKLGIIPRLLEIRDCDFSISFMISSSVNKLRLE